MRKKIIAAAAIQIAATLLLLTVTPLWTYALEKYGSDYTVSSTSMWCEASCLEEDGFIRFFIECDDVHVKGIKYPVSQYVVISADDPIYYMSGYNDNVSIHLAYCIEDAALSEKLNALYSDDSETFEGLEYFNLRQQLKNTTYDIKFRVFGSRVKFLSATVDGKELKAYLSELLGG